MNPKRGKGKGITFLRDNVSYAGDDCLPWPMSRHPTGYGSFGFERKILYAHRVMCELVHGPAPSPAHECAHSCGKGHLGCVNPRHLSWKTRAENEQDKIAHGRSAWGVNRPRRHMLTVEKVAQIRALGDTKTVTELSVMFNVTRSNIRKVLKYETWTDGTKNTGSAAQSIAQTRRWARERAARGK